MSILKVYTVTISKYSISKLTFIIEGLTFDIMIGVESIQMHL
jgi:hypothetical protein